MNSLFACMVAVDQVIDKPHIYKGRKPIAVFFSKKHCFDKEFHCQPIVAFRYPLRKLYAYKSIM